MKIREFRIELVDPGDDRPDEYRDYLPSFQWERELRVEYRVEGDGQRRAYRELLPDSVPVDEAWLEYLFRRALEACKAAERKAREGA